MKIENASHECSPSIEDLNNIKSTLLSNKNRDVLEQKKLEAVTYQIESYNRYQKMMEDNK